jgi:protein tyrosine phosphatase
MLTAPCEAMGRCDVRQMVNEFCYRAFRFEMTKPDAASVILVHCTHGFNRTGAMICHYACRNMPGMTVENVCSPSQSHQLGAM